MFGTNPYEREVLDTLKRIASALETKAQLDRIELKLERLESMADEAVTELNQRIDELVQNNSDLSGLVDAVKTDVQNQTARIEALTAELEALRSQGATPEQVSAAIQRLTEVRDGQQAIEDKLTPSTPPGE